MAGHLTGFRARLMAGPTAFTAWSAMREPAGIETLLREGFDSVVFDWQHGFHDQQSIEAGILTAQAMHRPALVRIGVGDFANAARFLDWGAAGIIAPMINSVSDAKAFVDFVKYPPLGGRSWGPARAMGFAGYTAAEQLTTGNDLTLAIAMIETREAYTALDDILGVAGIDGVLVGPSDLSITLTNGAAIDALLPEVDAALSHIAARAKAHGKIASAFCPDGVRAGELANRGYHLLAAGTDGSMFRAGAKAALSAARNGAASSATRSSDGYR
ncbi:HpcH 2,4-dihydroxyhept-2-ene-1,7-dioic acid aldolase [Rhabdaerophilaceae bacterium]